MKKGKSFNQGAIGTIVILGVIVFLGAATLIGTNLVKDKQKSVKLSTKAGVSPEQTEWERQKQGNIPPEIGPENITPPAGDNSRPDPATEANIYIYGDAGYYAIDPNQCYSSSPIINETIYVLVNNDNENTRPWLCDASGRPYYSFKAQTFGGGVFDIYPPTGTTCNQVSINVAPWGCVIFRRSSGSTCIFEGGCDWNHGLAPGGTPDWAACNEIKTRLTPNWSTRRCIVNTTIFAADGTIHAKTTAIPTSTPIPTPTNTPTPTPTETPPTSTKPDPPTELRYEVDYIPDQDFLTIEVCWEHADDTELYSDETRYMVRARDGIGAANYEGQNDCESWNEYNDTWQICKETIEECVLFDFPRSDKTITVIVNAYRQSFSDAISENITNIPMPAEPTSTELECVWCGENCVNNNPDLECFAVQPPIGASCENVDGICTIISGPTATTSPTNTESPSCPKKAQGDANCDDVIDIKDYEIILSALQGNDILDLCGDVEDCSADINGDSNVTILDYTIWLNSFLNINSTT